MAKRQRRPAARTIPKGETETAGSGKATVEIASILPSPSAKFVLQPTRRRGNPRSLRLPLIGAGVVALAAVAMLFFRQTRIEERPSVADIPYAKPELVQPKTEEVKGVADLPESRIVLAEREVTAVDEGGNNQYHYRFIAEEFTGSKRAVFAEADDLQYEPIVPFGSDGFVILSESEDGASRLLTLSGEPSSMKLPPYRFGGWLASPSRALLAYSRSVEQETATVDELVLRRTDGTEQVIPNGEFSSDETTVYPVLNPVAFNEPAEILFVLGLVDPDDPGTPYALFQVSTSSGSVQLVFAESGPTEAGRYRRFVAAEPELGFALVETLEAGSIEEVESEGAVLRLERFDLATKAFSSWAERSGLTVPLTPGVDPVSPDGRFVALESGDPEIAGIVVWNTADGTFTRMTDQGSFLAWSPDSRFLLIEDLATSEDGSYALRSLELETRRQFAIIEQVDAIEGTGLNAVGDRFLLFLGVSG